MTMAMAMHAPPDYHTHASTSSTVLPAPAYSPSDESPLYAPEPSGGEQRLDYVARTNEPRAPSGTFTKRLRNITITLSGQEEGAVTPVYARNSVVRGELQLDGEDNVLSVVMTLEGRQVLSVTEGGSSLKALFLKTHTVWTRKKGDTQTQCPTILPFAMPFPPNYREKDIQHPVPPSFAVSFPGMPGLTGKNSYLLSVHITKPRFRGSWKQHKTLSLHVQYHPRTRPFLPICPSLHPFFATVKSSPGEWHQVSSTMDSRDESVDPVDCHLFIPSVQIYAVSDTIPIHLQLRGARKSLCAFLHAAPPPPAPPPPRLGLGLSLRASRSSSSSSASSSTSSLFGPHSVFGALPRGMRACADDSRPVVRVFLLRQVTAKVHGQKAWRSVVQGEGELAPLQHVGVDDLRRGPGAGAGAGSDEALEALDWEGELRCNEDVKTGSFTAGEFMVKDFIVLHLRPPSPHTSPLLEHQHAHPVRLVTDTYREAYDYVISD